MHSWKKTALAFPGAFPCPRKEVGLASRGCGNKSLWQVQDAERGNDFCRLLKGSWIIYRRNLCIPVPFGLFCVGVFFFPIASRCVAGGPATAATCPRGAGGVSPRGFGQLLHTRSLTSLQVTSGVCTPAVGPFPSLHFAQPLVVVFAFWYLEAIAA